ncbi:MAG: hypothetical protein HY466_00895 [Deltaproteobacteria bacterium]|nr:hypothetical protein [Deltaproteobacteria bacterium]
MKKAFFTALAIFWLAACSQPDGAPSLSEEDGAGPANNQSLSGDSNLFNSLKNPNSQKLVYHVGPVDLLAGESGELTLENAESLNFQVSEPVWVTGFNPKVIDADGRELSGQLLHKAILFNKSEPNPVCATGNGGNPFAAATSALTKVELPEGFGYPLLPDDPLEAKVVFQNKSEQDFLSVMFEFDLETVPMEQAQAYSDVKAVLLDPDPCEHKPLTLEPGEFIETNKTFTIPEGGHLMVANGVLSNYGVAVSLTHSEGGDVSVIPFWRAEAQLNADHQIVDLTPNPFLDPEGKKINEGDKMTLGISFDNFSNSWNNEATGGAMIYLAPENPS